MLKKVYRTSEWEEKVEYYSSAVQNLILMENPNSKEISMLEARVDALLTEAMLDRAYIKTNSDTIENDIKLREKELSFKIRMNPGMVTSEPLTKPTEKMIEGLVVTYIRQNPFPPFKKDMYSMRQLFAERLNFIEEVVRILHDKKTALEIMARMLKIESTFVETVNGRDFR